MPVGAGARRRFAVVPVLVLVLPLRCSLVDTLPDTAPAMVNPAATPTPSPAEPIARPAEPTARPAEPIARRAEIAPGPSAATPKREEPIARIASVPPPAPAPTPTRRVTLPDEVIVKTIDTGRQGFLACWKHAQRSDLPPVMTKVRLHLELDALGRVELASSDSDSPVLSRCLAMVARRLAFPASGRRAAIDLPVMFP